MSRDFGMDWMWKEEEGVRASGMNNWVDRGTLYTDGRSRLGADVKDEMFESLRVRCL